MGNLYTITPRYRFLAFVLEAGGKVYTSCKYGTKFTNITLSDGDRRAANSSGTGCAIGDCTLIAPLSPTGAGGLYCEFEINAVGGGVAVGVGIVTLIATTDDPRSATNHWTYRSDGQKNVSATVSAYGSAYAATDVIGLALVDGSLWWSKNGAWQNAGDVDNALGAIAGSTSFGRGIVIGGTGTFDVSLNVGQRPFKYAPPGRAAGRWRISAADVQRFFATKGFVTSTDGGTNRRHFAPKMANDPGYLMMCRFAVWGPRGNDDQVGLGDVELINTDGALDFLLESEFRDRKFTLYRDTLPGNNFENWEKLASGVIEDIRRKNADTLKFVLLDSAKQMARALRTAVYPTTAPNEAIRNVARPAAIGDVRWANVVYYDAPNSRFSVHETADYQQIVEVRDQGAVVTYRTGWAELSNTIDFGYRRLNAVAGRQCVQLKGHVKLGAILIDEAFGSWTGDNPTGWTVQEGDANNCITQWTANQARFRKNGAAGQVHMEKNVLTAGQLYVCEVRLVSFTSGVVHFRTRDGSNVESATLFQLDTNMPAGTYRFSFTPAAGHTYFRALMLTAATVDMDLDDLKVWPATNMQRLPDLLEFVAVTRTGAFTTGGLDTTTINGLNTKAPYLLGGMIGDGEHGDDFLKRVLDSFWGDFYILPSGNLGVCRLEVPGGTPVLTLTDANIIGPVQVSLDTAPGLSTQLGYARNYAVHSPSELAGSVQATSVAGELTAEWRIARVSVNLPDSYRHAVNGPVMPTMLTDATNANNEVGRRVGSYRVERQVYVIPTALTDQQSATLKPGQVVFVQTDDADLDVGKYLQVYGLGLHYLDNDVDVHAWG